MKIAYDAKRLFNNYTGLGNYSRTILQNFSHYHPEHELYLYTPQIKYNEQTAPFTQANSAFSIHASKALFKAMWRSFGVLKDLRKENIKLYHGLSNEIPYVINQKNITTIVTIHDLIFELHPSTYTWAEQKVYHQKFKYACKYADKIIAISEHTKKDIINIYDIEESKIDVIYQACNPIFYLKNELSFIHNVLNKYNLSKPYFLYVGSVIERKNLKLIINAYYSNKELHNYPIVIVGKGSKYLSECKRLIKQYQLDNQFIWLEKLHNNYELQALYQQAIALVYPSLYEGFGLPIAEALLCKCPVITTPCSSLPEAAGAHSLFVSTTNEVALAQSMMLLATNTNEADKMRQLGYEYAINTFQPANLSQKLNNLYNSLF